MNAPPIPSLAALLILTGCGGEVRLSTGDPGACEVGAASAVEITHPSSGAFVGGQLHLSARIDGGEERYLVLSLKGGSGFLISTPEALNGPADLAPAGPGRHARLRISAGQAVAEVVDTSDPLAPKLLHSFALTGAVPPEIGRVFSVIDGCLITCLGAPGAEAEPTAIALDTGAAKALQHDWSHPCGGFTNPAGAAAHERSWVSWGAESDLNIFDVSASAITRIADYQYNPSGVHAYGNVLSASTDGRRIAFDPSNPSRFFFYAVGSGDPSITHARLDLPSPKKLLGVAGEVAYIATATGVRAYDLTPIDGAPNADEYSPPLLDFHADIDLGEGLAELIAADDTWLALADAEGRLYVIDRSQSGPATPLQVFKGPPPACAP